MEPCWMPSIARCRGMARALWSPGSRFASPTDLGSCRFRAGLGLMEGDLGLL